MALALFRRLRPKGVPGRAGLSLSLPPGAGALGCEVLDPLGQPMGGADVTVSAAGAHQVLARGTTDPYGYFLAVLPAGRYSVMVAAEGLTPYRETVDLLDGVMLPAQRVQSEPGHWTCRYPAPGSSTRRTPRSGSSPSTSEWARCTAASSGSRAASRSRGR